MRKFWLPLTLLVMLVLTACASAASSPTAAAAKATPSLAGRPTQAILSTPAPVTCVANPRPTPNPTDISQTPPITADDWTTGPASAAVTIVEYADYQCPGCAQTAPVLDRLTKAYPNDLRFVYRSFPLPYHDKALISVQAAEAAGLQGKYWEMHNTIFNAQNTWVNYSLDAFESWVKDQAKKLGLNVDQFTADMKSDALVKKAKTYQDDALKLEIPQTPWLIINGRPYTGSRDYDSLVAVVKLLQFTSCPPTVIVPGKQYTATITTAKGNIVIKLLPEAAPVAVNNFVFLARKGFYDGVTFHRVVANFVAQAGDPSGTGGGGPGYAFGNEISSLKFDQPGMVGMANAGPDSNGSQFFITYSAQPTLDGKYTIFGQVISGMDVAQKLTPREQKTGSTVPPAGDKILKVTIEEK